MTSTVSRASAGTARRSSASAIGPYSWWSYRGRAFDNDTGWRIDHLLTTPGLADAAHEAVVDRAPAHDRRFSDHAPVVVRLGAV